MTPPPNLVFCAKKQWLISEFTIAVSSFLQLQSEQLKSVITGDGFGFEEEIQAAAQRKDEAKQTVLDHRKGHGC